MDHSRRGETDGLDVEIETEQRTEICENGAEKGPMRCENHKTPVMLLMLLMSRIHAMLCMVLPGLIE